MNTYSVCSRVREMAMRFASSKAFIRLVATQGCSSRMLSRMAVVWCGG